MLRTKALPRTRGLVGLVLFCASASLLLGCAHDASAEPRDSAQAAADNDAALVLDAALLDAGTGPTGDSAVDSALDASSPEADASTPDASAFDASTTPRTREALVVPGLWVPLEAGTDPFDDRSADAHCSPAGLMAETLGGEAAFSVNTGECNYVTVTQPTRRQAAAGDILKVRLWHFELSAPEPAEAHAAVWVDGLRILDERIPIPQAGGLISRQLKLERALPAGAPVLFHLHTHGANSWSLVEVSTGP